jgi:hypothetical protein
LHSAAGRDIIKAAMEETRMARLQLTEHPKFKLALSLLRISKPLLLGHLELLYHSAALRLSPRFDNAAELEAAAEWAGRRGHLAAVLVQCRLVDREDTGALILHDWIDHCPDYIRKRLARAAASPSIAPTSAASAASVPAAARAAPLRIIPAVNPLDATPPQIVSLLVALETNMEPAEARRYWCRRLARHWPDGNIPRDFRKALGVALKIAMGKNREKLGTLKNPAQWLNARLDEIAQKNQPHPPTPNGNGNTREEITP